MGKRVLIGEFKHETNVFCSTKTDIPQFQARSLKLGDEILPFFKGVRVEMGGIIAGCEEEGLEMVPSVAANAMPGGLVTQEAFEFVRDEMVKAIKSVGSVDGIVLSLHGAMVVENYSDGEGMLLTALREVVGPDVPIMASLDHHTNLTNTMLEQATALFAYDTYPHIDQYDRGYEAAKTMARVLRGEINPVMHGKRVPILAPALQTAKAPMKDFLEMAHRWEEDPRVISVSVIAGFPWADIPDCGCAVIAVTDEDGKLAQEIVDSIADNIWARREECVLTPVPLEEAVRRAMEAPEGPVVLADVADNPGGGGSGDTIYILKELLRQGAKNVAMAIIWDPETIEQAVAAGVGSRIKVRLGGKMEPQFPDSIEVEATVKTIADGIFINKGPMGRGLRNDVGRLVALDIDGIEVVIPERRIQPWDPEIFRRVGIEPTDKQIVVVKSSLHFRAAFTPIASEIIEVDAPGITAINFHQFNFKNVTRPIFPLD
ncbi:MAG: M81 family metallopeptidase [bacterium]